MTRPVPATLQPAALLPATLLFAAADPGGANALLPVIGQLVARGRDVAIVAHGFLGRNAPGHWRRLAPPGDEDPAAWLGRQGGIAGYGFGTSLADHLPLRLARAARDLKLPVVCVLDNWMNYRARLEMDGAPMVIPDLYAVMDDKARGEAVTEGVPESCLRVTGHPGLAGLAADIAGADAARRMEIRRQLGLGLADRELVVFVGEPVAADQGTGPETPGWRGYTERQVLPLLCRALQPMAGRLDVAILPHPRDDVAALEGMWTRCRGMLAGKVVQGMGGRPVVLAADRVAGMASILLYEAWLQGKPAISLQPGLVRPDLAAAVGRPGIVLVTDEEKAEKGIAQWLAAGQNSIRPDCRLHAQAPERLADLMQHLAGMGHGEA
jgi:hypothetical protein